MINLIAKKIGMSHVYQESGTSIPLTMVQLYDNCVIDLNVNIDKEFDNILVGFNKRFSGTIWDEPAEYI